MESYAMIENGIVVNVISLRRSQAHEFPGSVELGDIPAMIGDTYSDGIFYRHGEQVKSTAQLLEEARKDAEEAFAILQGVEE